MPGSKKYSVLSAVLLLFEIELCFGGPPFFTDDPETVMFRHQEYYISSVNSYMAGIWTGTSPHFEFNYGLAPDVQVHLLLPLNYDYVRARGGKIGYADTEFGIKYRFIKEKDNFPQVGIFPLAEIPTIGKSEFSNGKIKIFLPVWAQKSWGKFTTYGGAGYWINPGEGNRNWIFSGWEVQYSFSDKLTIGGELFYHTASTNTDSSGAGFNLGGSVNPSEKFHIIFSAGHSLTGNTTFNSYIGLLWTI